MQRRELIPDYEKSWALLIGIDDYGGALPPLNTAVKGATGLANVLEDALGFNPNQIILLTDGEATQRNIRRALTDPLSRRDRVSPNDRVLIYFAGHGLTFDTAEGEVGCIAPADVEGSYIDSTIPMDELTRLANRIHAKHVLFLLDACFSGFATTRDASTGVERQVADFLQRPARQVITAGTREQAVSDYWGPGGHSLFSGFVIEGLRGAAPSPGGVTRAFHLAGYLQDQVAQHSRSLQTPQYAALIGSQGGDFIFRVRQPGEISAIVLEAAAHSDPAQRLLAVGRLHAMARQSDQPDRAARAMARLEQLAEEDEVAMVRSSARAALRDIIPHTHVAPIVREELAEVATRPEADAEAQAPAPVERGARPAPSKTPATVIGTFAIAGGPLDTRRVEVAELPMTIGRTPGNVLVLPDDKVSRRHAQVEVRDGILWIVDRGSTNGTFLNGEPLDRPRRLRAGDQITIGTSTLTFAPASQAARAAPVAPDATPVEPLKPAARARPVPEHAPRAERARPAPEWQTVPDSQAAVPAAASAGTGDEAEKAARKKRNLRILVIAGAVFALCTCIAYLAALSSGY